MDIRISFVASANCGIYCGATVDFVDVDQIQLILFGRT